MGKGDIFTAWWDPAVSVNFEKYSTLVHYTAGLHDQSFVDQTDIG